MRKRKKKKTTASLILTPVDQVGLLHLLTSPPSLCDVRWRIEPSVAREEEEEKAAAATAATAQQSQSAEKHSPVPPQALHYNRPPAQYL